MSAPVAPWLASRVAVVRFAGSIPASNPTSAAPGGIQLQLLEWSALTDRLMHARTCRDAGEGEVTISYYPSYLACRALQV